MTTPNTTIAAFDLGIKNLSYCIATFDGSGNLIAILRWTNMSLLADGASSQSQTRCPCGGPASYKTLGDDSVSICLLCKKCAKKQSRIPLELGPKAKIGEWRSWMVVQIGVSTGDAKKMKKAEMEEKALAIRLVPYKAIKVKEFSLQAVLQGMESCLSTELPHLKAASRIRIEHQPCDFAPHMKSIQIMLFTLLDHRLRSEYGWTGSSEFAHASVKTRGTAAVSGKDGKRSRKMAAIEKVSSVLSTHTDEEVRSKHSWWRSQAKQDDLADAFLMCLDAGIKG
jgi:hypothetical protein